MLVAARKLVGELRGLYLIFLIIEREGLDKARLAKECRSEIVVGLDNGGETSENISTGVKIKAKELFGSNF